MLIHRMLTDNLAGMSDRHNDHGHRATKDIAGAVPGRNVTEALRADGTATGRPGDTKFGSHAFKEDSSFRDTHQERPRNGTGFVFEDHKEDFNRNGKHSEAHSANPDGSRVDAEANTFHQADSLADVQHKNGALDSAHTEAEGSDWSGRFQKHHAGPDNSDAKDSKINGDMRSDSMHQKEEHRDANVHTLHEESSKQGSFSWNVVGNDALKDFATESGNWPKNVPRDASYIEVRPTTEQDLARRDQGAEQPMEQQLEATKVIPQTTDGEPVQKVERRNIDYPGTYDIYACVGKDEHRICMPPIVKREAQPPFPPKPTPTTEAELTAWFEILWGNSKAWRDYAGDLETSNAQLKNETQSLKDDKKQMMFDHKLLLVTYYLMFALFIFSVIDNSSKKRKLKQELAEKELRLKMLNFS